MEQVRKTKRKRIYIVLLTVVLIIGLLCGGCLVFLLDCYPADRDAIDSFMPEAVAGETDGRYTVFAPENPVAGFIFYPGAKVEHEAYIPLMQACAAEGMLCILVEMPLYFPLLWGDSADGLQAKYPEIDCWYIGGHSLGGYAAANYLAKHTADYAGLVLLASYSGADLTESGRKVLSVYGTEDQIMNRERYQAGLSNLPAGYTELVIDGGCHAYFGMYDGQDGHSGLSVTNEAQLWTTARAIRDWMDK